jgi:hypothetical protein
MLVSIRQLAYVSIRQHTSAYVSDSRPDGLLVVVLVSIRQLAYVSIRQHTSQIRDPTAYSL